MRECADVPVAGALEALTDFIGFVLRPAASLVTAGTGKTRAATDQRGDRPPLFEQPGCPPVTGTVEGRRAQRTLITAEPWDAKLSPPPSYFKVSLIDEPRAAFAGTRYENVPRP